MVLNYWGRRRGWFLRWEALRRADAHLLSSTCVWMFVVASRIFSLGNTAILEKF
jgi:hypothetical protein